MTDDEPKPKKTRRTDAEYIEHLRERIEAAKAREAKRAMRPFEAARCALIKAANALPPECELQVVLDTAATALAEYIEGGAQ